MKKQLFGLAIAALCSSALYAQGGGMGGMQMGGMGGMMGGRGQAGAAGEVQQAYNQIKTNLIGAANDMAEENYSFKPMPEEMSFGQWVAHVADSQMNTCSNLNGAPKQLGAAQKTSKADLVAALKQSFDECDTAYNALTDANALEMVAAGRGQRSRIGQLTYNIEHDNECYGSMAVYLRLKGVVPPSTAARGARGARGGGQMQQAPAKKQ